MAADLSAFSASINEIVGDYSDFSVLLDLGVKGNNTQINYDFVQDSGNLALALECKVAGDIKGQGDAGSTTSTLNVTGETFVTKKVKPGDVIQNKDTGEYGLIASITDEDTIVTSVMSESWDGANFVLKSGWVAVSELTSAASQTPYTFPATGDKTLHVGLPISSVVTELRLRGSVSTNDSSSLKIGMSRGFI